MISGRDIIIFNDDWGRFPSTLQHVAKVLIQNNNRVFWIGSLGLRRPKLNFSDLIRAVQKLSRVIVRKKNPKVTQEFQPILIHPLVIPLHDIKLVKKLNAKSIIKSVRKALVNHGAKKPILITSSPVTDEIIGKLGESSSFYYCVDDYSNMEGAFKTIPDSEKKIIQKVDGLFAVSRILLDTRSHERENHFIPQGVNTQHFSKIDIIAEQLSGLQKPIVGFFGLIAEWIDLDLIDECAKKYPTYTFVIIGKSNRDLSILFENKNVVYIGPVPYENLPKFASAFNLGLIPFAINPVTLASNPLKLLEYFSMGMPVVSTNLPEMKIFNGLAYIAESRREFIEMIDAAVKESSDELNALRRQKAEEYSWTAITSRVFETIEQIEQKKNSHN